MLVYMIVAGDILAGGGKGYPGLVCDLAGPKAGSWCSDRPLIITATTILAFAPLCSFKCEPHFGFNLPHNCQEGGREECLDCMQSCQGCERI